jgi:hypothetical protein
MSESVRRVAAGFFTAVLAAALTVGVPTAATAAPDANVTPGCGSSALDV